jgi:hypothetical protein
MNNSNSGNGRMPLFGLQQRRKNENSSLLKSSSKASGLSGKKNINKINNK